MIFRINDALSDLLGGFQVIVVFVGIIVSKQVVASSSIGVKWGLKGALD